MADSTINGLTALTGANVDNTADQFPIWQNSASTTKKITRTELLTGIPAGTAAAPAITFAGDATTGIYAGATSRISFSTAGSLRAYISPNGIFSAATGTAAAPCISQTADTNTGLYFPAADTLGLVTGGSERLRIDSNGLVVAGNTSGSNVGTIPTGTGSNATPTLQVCTTSSFAAVAAGVTDGSRNRRIGLFSDDTNGVVGISWTYGSGGAIPFVIRQATSEYVRIDSAGQVGIGKTPSLGLLDVNGDSYFNTVRVGLGGGAVSTNMAVGNNAITATATGTSNIAIGPSTLTAVTSGSDNTAVGRAALNAVQTGSNNVAVGRSALLVNTASDNTAVGYAALSANTSGTSNTAVGRSAGAAITTANYNVAVGQSALATTTVNGNCVAVGFEALRVNTVSDNTAVGFQALTANTSGTNNVAVGRSALSANTTGGGNTCVGRSALAANTGSDNTAVGYNSLLAATSASNNSAFGRGSLANATTGWDNTAIGYFAGSALTTGANNTIIGSLAAASAVGGTGQIVIGKGVTGTANNRITVGITTNIAELDLDGADTSWAASSDERLKKNVADYAAGLDVITALRPVTYQWRSRKEVPTELTNYYADSDEPVHGDASKTYHGFIAQEVKAVLDANPSVPNGQHLWEQRDDGVQTLAPADLVPILVNAIKQLNAEVQALKNK